MNKGLFRKVTSLVLGFLLVLTGILSGRGGIGKVRAAGTYTLTYTLGTATVGNAYISIRFMNGEGAQLGDIEMASIGTNVTRAAEIRILNPELFLLKRRVLRSELRLPVRTDPALLRSAELNSL
ncbi:MAG: hypothetical protein K6G43_00060 [Lachnospiraceae bacterium]|nr:hypothetical protein [Lachnospiraceae bacterium]